MKKYVLIAAICCCHFTLQAQENKPEGDSLIKGISLQDCPAAFATSINAEALKTKAALLVCNESLHPLGRHEFYDNGTQVPYLNTRLRMNRCTLLYIDTGLHQFRTMYQELTIPVIMEQGKIYMARLFTRTIWPLGGTSIIKKNEKGEPVEYAAVLFEYINSAKATELLDKMNKKEIVANE